MNVEMRLIDGYEDRNILMGVKFCGHSNRIIFTNDSDTNTRL